MLKPPKTNCHDTLLEAAEAIVQEAGAAHLTLDAVAARAGVSKGGLMYHFPSKEALLDAMVARCVRKTDDARLEAIASQPAGPLRELRGEIVAQLKLHLDNACVNGGMIGVMANQPELLEPFRGQFKRRFNELVAGHPEPDRAAVLLFATYGICLLHSLRLSPVDGARREAIVRELLAQLDRHGVEP